MCICEFNGCVCGHVCPASSRLQIVYLCRNASVPGYLITSVLLYPPWVFIYAAIQFHSGRRKERGGEEERGD